MFEWIFVGDRALEIVGALVAAIADRPGFLVVVAGGGGGGPDVAVSGDFSTVVEIVEHAELQGELVLVGRDVGAVHGERAVAVADFQVAEDLIVGAIFFDDVDHVLDGGRRAGNFIGAGWFVSRLLLRPRR